MPAVWNDPVPLPDAFGDSPDQVFHYDDSFKSLQLNEDSTSAKPVRTTTFSYFRIRFELSNLYESLSS